MKRVKLTILFLAMSITIFACKDKNKFKSESFLATPVGELEYDSYLEKIDTLSLEFMESASKEIIFESNCSIIYYYDSTFFYNLSTSNITSTDIAKALNDNFLSIENDELFLFKESLIEFIDGFKPFVISEYQRGLEKLRENKILSMQDFTYLTFLGCHISFLQGIEERG